MKRKEIVEAGYTGKGNHRPGWMLKADPSLAKKVKDSMSSKRPPKDSKSEKSVSEGDVVQFPKKHPYELLSNCTKCGGPLQGGKDEKGRLKLCIPCMKIFRAPNQQDVTESSGDTAAQRKAERDRQRTSTAKKERDQAQRKGLVQDKDGTYYAKKSVAEADKHSILGKIQRGHELKKKVDTSFADIGKAQQAGDHNAASKAFRKHERYANLERPGTWTKVKEQGVAEGIMDVSDDNLGPEENRMLKNIYWEIEQLERKHFVGDRQEAMVKVASAMPNYVRANKDQYKEFFNRAYDVFYGIRGDDEEGEFDDYTDYSMRQGELGNPDRMRESTDEERKEKRTRLMIADYEQRARATKSDIKKRHFLDMAQQLRDKLKTSDDNLEEAPEHPLSPKNAAYILRKLDNGVPLHTLIDEFPELEDMIEEIIKVHNTENFDHIEHILSNDLNDLANEGEDEEWVDEAGEQQLKVSKVDTATGNVTAVNPQTNQPTQIKASDLKPDPTKPGTFTTTLTGPKGVEAGNTITAKVEDVERLRRLAGL